MSRARASVEDKTGFSQTSAATCPETAPTQDDDHKLRRLRRPIGPRRAAMRAVRNEILQFDLPARPPPRPPSPARERRCALAAPKIPTKLTLDLNTTQVSFGSILVQRDQYDTYWGVQSSHAKSASASLTPATTSRERRSRCAVAAAASGRARPAFAWRVVGGC